MENSSEENDLDLHFSDNEEETSKEATANSEPSKKITKKEILQNSSKLDMESWDDCDQKSSKQTKKKKSPKCKLCGKSFSKTVYLNKHIHIVHEGHKDYKCESCDKSFSQSQNLKIHIHTVHEGHKDHKCESCGKSFSSAQVLKKHIHAIHKGRDFQETHPCNS